MQDADVMQKLKAMGWEPDHDPAVVEVTRGLMNKMATSIRSLVEHAYANNQMNSLWVHQRASWEKGTDEQVSNTRKEFMAACTRNGSEAKFVEDAQKRWEKAEFTVVTADWYVVGSVASPRPKTCSLVLKEERDDVVAGVEVGRENVTYLTYPEIKSSIEGVRMKIDGDRFTVQKRGNSWFLVGYKDYEMREDPGFTVAERYAGQYAVISPPGWQTKQIRLKDGDVFIDAIFKAHPFMSIADVPKHHFTSSKYEGIMLLSKGREYRAKWRATAEVLVGGVVWEVTRDPDNVSFPFRLLRPRPGKIPSTEGAASTMMNSCLPGKAIVPILKTLDVVQPVSVKPTQIGSKCFFLNATGNGFYVIKDGSKPLDLVGGSLEKDEQPVDAMVREVFEELRVKMLPSQFLLIGDSVDESDNRVWKSHVFLAVAPPIFSRHPSVFLEERSIAAFRKHMLVDRSKYQPWLNRLLMFVESVGDFKTLRTLMVMGGCCEVFRGMGISTTAALEVANRLGFSKLLESLYQHARQVRHHGSYDAFYKYVCGQCDPVSTESEWQMIVADFYSKKTRVSVEIPEEVEEEVVVGDTAAVHAFPMSKLVAQNLLKEIFGERNTTTMLAQDLYRSFSQKRYPGTRAAKIKFMKNCELWGIVTSANSVVGGRKFTLV